MIRAAIHALVVLMIFASGCNLVVGFEPPAEDGPQCSDGVDNDGNGKSDCEESSCLAFCNRCGDGKKGGSEACDDGNNDNTDLCLNNCTAARCGDGIVASANNEACDQGADNSDTLANRCRSNCQPARCGDMVLDSGEGCDWGMDNDDTLADHCRTNCKSHFCGDGVQDTGEGCDDGNQDDTDACKNSCAPKDCGNGKVDPGEDCDDGNTSNTDACLSTCVDATCGDGFVHAGSEMCDDGNASNTDACPDGVGGTCQPARCGDGFTLAGTEQCDDGNASNSDGCPDGVGGTCQPARCGDGFTLAGVEQCDDGNGQNGDTCPDGIGGSCQAARCGDGFTLTGVEQCDDGNASNTDGCLDGLGGTCQLAKCGDGVTRAGVEMCDDGNASNADGCPDGVGGSCQPASCGDGFLRTGVEDCDDNNQVPDDGCEPACTFTCAPGLSVFGRAFDPVSKHCYLGFAQPTSVGALDAACRGLGGYPAVPNSPAEDALIRVAAPADAILGLVDFDRDPGYQFRLITGDLPATYLNFGGGEPNLPSSSPVCVGYAGTLPTWQDLVCDEPHPYVCEIHPSPCGDFVLQPGEQCDDGNVNPGDGCTAACVDEDECDLGTDNCSPNATCTNEVFSPGQPGFTCQCNEGFVGDGVTCTPLPDPPLLGPRPPTVVSGSLNDCTTAKSQTGRKIAIDQLGVLYAIMRCAGAQTLVTRSLDGGATWSTPTSLGSGTADATVVAQNAGTAAVVMLFQNGDVAARRSVDFGATWSPPKPVASGASTTAGVSASMFGNIPLVVAAQVGPTLKVLRATDPSLDTFVSSDTVDVAFGDVLVDPQAPSEVWAAGNGVGLQLRKSTDDGFSFPSPPLSPPGTLSASDWAIGGGHLHGTGSEDTVIRIPTASPTASFTTGGLPAADPEERSIAADGGGALVVAQAGAAGLQVVRLAPNASVFDPPFNVDPVADFPSVTALPNGLWAVVYTSGSQIKMSIVGSQGGPGAVGGLIHRWSFEGNADDQIGQADGSLFGGAFMSGGRLILDGLDDHMRTSPIEAPIGSRTLVAWVALQNLSQGAGSVLTLEDPTNTDIFDGIVYAESSAQEWIAGSDFHNRTQSGNVPPETAAAPTVVMMAISYEPNGNITMYRNGAIYRAPYNPGAPMITYPSQVADVTIGVRHADVIGQFGTAGGQDPYFAGEIEEARIYDHALNAAEVGLLFASGPNGGVPGGGQPLRSCKEIQQSSPQVPSGVFFIDPDGVGPGSDFQVFCDMTTDGGGWTMVYKVSAGVGGVDPVTLWSGGPHNEGDFQLLDVTADSLQYANRLITSHWNVGGYPVAEARVSVYVGATETLGLKFNTQGSANNNWFAQANLTADPWSDLPGPTDFFAITGNSPAGHGWFINKTSGTCFTEAGWLVVDVAPTPCTWEANRGPFPAIVYSPAPTAQSWDTGTVTSGDTFVVWIR